jgi:inosose dehydratase
MTEVMLERVAGAPITWGVCEVPGWGHQMHRDRVLSEMGSIGLRATELGPEGFLPTDLRELQATLAAHGLRAVAAFVPLVLHEPALRDRELGRAAAAAAALAACGAEVLVVAAARAANGYEGSADLDGTGWTFLLTGLERVTDLAADRGLMTALHPHVGTVVERREHIDRVLHDSTTPLCLDTGHLILGGTDPSTLALEAADRIAHVHLKDVDAELADRVRRGRLGYQDAVAAGLYRPLGDGDLDIDGSVRTLEGSGYRGWYVLEQDAVLSSEPAPDEGPVRAAEKSLAYLAAVASSSNDVMSLVGEGKRGTPHGAATHGSKGGMG